MLLLLSLAGLLTGCVDLAEMNFKVDDRLTWITPRERETVETPISLTWQIRNFRIEPPDSAPPTDRSGYFAIFVDRAPVRPGQSLNAIAVGDEECAQTPGCPDKKYLADHQVYTTTDTSFTLKSIVPLSSETDQQTQTDRVTIVLVDTSGHRIGESAWSRDFITKVESG